MNDSQSPESPSPNIPEVKDKRSAITGLLPKNAQARVLAGVALLMVVIIVLSGRSGPKEHPATPPAGTSAIDPSQSRIQEYRARLEDQTRQLQAEEAQLAQTKLALGVPSPPVAGAGAARVPNISGAFPAYRTEPGRNWMEIDREKRAYQGLYASSMALSYRRAKGQDPGEPASESKAGATHGAGASAEVPGQKAEFSSRQFRLFEGTILETVLTNRLEGSFSGPVNAMVTTDVYAPDHETLLIPQGTRVLGEVRKVETAGQQRLAVVFHRLIMPDGYSVSLDQFHGLNQIGETGLRDQVNHHYLQIFGVSLAIGAIAGFSQANTQYGISESAADAYRQGAAASLSQSSLHILDRYLNVLPTFTIREGQRIKVYLSQDLRLPPYDQHPLADNLGDDF